MAGTNGNGAKPDDGWVIDLNGIKRHEADAFEAAFNHAKDAQNDSGLFVWAAKIIKKWPFESDPSDPESYPALGLLDYAEAMARFGNAFQPLREATQKMVESGNAGNEGGTAGTSESA